MVAAPSPLLVTFFAGGVALAAVAFAVAPQGAPPPVAPLPVTAPTPARDRRAADALGWRLSTQAWTFRDRTAFEVVDVAAKLGLDWIEFFPGQPLRPDARDVKVGPEMPAEQLAAFRQKLADAKVRAGGFGVADVPKDEAGARKLFDFVKALGIENLVAEPESDSLDLIEQLAGEYEVKVAFHNHPEPSRYWNPDVVLAAIKGRSARMGSCSDTGHWTRSGLVPVDCLKKLEGRVIELHFKDLDAFGKKGAQDVPWGGGKSDAQGILRELKRQGFQGLIHVEYETGQGAELEVNVAKCIAWFDATARALLNETKR